MGLLSYIRGDRKGKAAHELERKAMQDPFLSEALDGYDDADVQDTDKRLLRLQERVSRRTRKRRVPIYGAVAAVLLLSLSVSIYLFTRYELPDEELAVLAESRTVDTLSIMMPAGNGANRQTGVSGRCRCRAGTVEKISKKRDGCG